MSAFLLGLMALVLVLFGLNAFANADPKKLVAFVRRAGGVLLIGVGAVFLFHRQWVWGVPAVVYGLSLLGLRVPYTSGFGARMHRSPGQSSTVRGEWVEMALDHDNGTMSGRVLKGEHAGRGLNELGVEDLIGLLGAVDADSAALLEAYLDRRAPGWREDAEADAGRGQGERGPVQGPMSQEEAYEVLGLAPGASDADIRRAHRALMKRLHPDRGGSTYLAAKINEAKDLLLKTHRKRS
ncbi:MAG: DnaJ domain-containing protein [Rhodobiaceae bacterium]|nr:DnaJ domain-containing protein [Rhodobiaceae bacterium]MCC0041789.1 DnaJ domain-containing protein [Rhodobiaceae bacterium]